MRLTLKPVLLALFLFLLGTGSPLLRTARAQTVVDLGRLGGVNGIEIPGLHVGDITGIAVSGTGDLNADGIDDLAIGARAADPGGRGGAGTTYVVFGTRDGSLPARLDLAALDGSNGFILNGAAPGDFSGCAVAAAGDLNADGIDDLAVGAFGADSGRGACYVIFGSAQSFPAALELAELDGTRGTTLHGMNPTYSGTGRSVASAGDLDGDGIGDLIIGAPQAFGDENSGEAYVVFGRAGAWPASIDLSQLDGASGFRISGYTSPGYVGNSVAAAGDVNADGIGDVVIGASEMLGDDGRQEGAGFVVFGSNQPFPATLHLTALDGSNGFRIRSAHQHDQTGYSVAGGSDLNGDGIADLVVSAPHANAPSRYDVGAVYVLYGSPSPFPASVDLADVDGTNGFKILGTHEDDRAGRAVSIAGDLNDDGIDDLALTTLPDLTERTSEAYVIFGTRVGRPALVELEHLGPDDGFVLRLEGPERYSGMSVGNAGDLNDDGIDDMLVGLYTQDVDGKDSVGVAYLVFGRHTACLAGNINSGQGSIRNVLHVNGSAGNPRERAFIVRGGEAITISIVQPPNPGNGKFVVHANDGRPSALDNRPLPAAIGTACFPLLFPEATPVAIWNNAGRRGRIGASRYFDGSPLPDPNVAPTDLISLPAGDAMHLPPGTVITIQGVILDNGGSSHRRASITNGVILQVVP